MTATHQPNPDHDKTGAIAALEAAYGAPSQAAFGSAVFHDPSTPGVALEQAALATYRYFVGDQWDRFGEAWQSVAFRQKTLTPIRPSVVIATT